jgi:1-acyl-sn-glycerol-3-phosphate acyltransferase
MKTSKIKTLWIILAAIYYTFVTTGLSVIRGLLGTANRAWVDKQMQVWVKQIMALMKIDCKVVNPHHVEAKPEQVTIIMCNHTSLFDIPLSLYAFPKLSIRMLAKKELSRIPIMSGGMRAAEFPFIDRKNKRQAIQDLEKVEKLLASGIVMWIAPEGTRSKDGRLAPFKKGAFITAISAKATIIPIGIRGACDILPARSFQLNINQKAEVHIGKPIDASAYTLETKDALIAETFQAMKKLVGE